MRQLLGPVSLWISIAVIAAGCGSNGKGARKAPATRDDAPSADGGRGRNGNDDAGGGGERFKPKKPLDAAKKKRGDAPAPESAAEVPQLDQIDIAAVLANHDGQISDEERAFGAARIKGGISNESMREELEALDKDLPQEATEETSGEAEEDYLLRLTMDGESIVLAGYDSPVKDQGEEGACTAFATVAAIESATRDGNDVLDLAEQDLWSLQEYVQNATNAMNAALVEGGLVREEVWPYGSEEPVKSVEGEGLARLTGWEMIAMTRPVPLMRRLFPVNLMAVYNHLQQTELPVVATFATNESWYDESGIVQSGLPLQETGHAVLVVGMVLDQSLPGGGAMLIKNSWGTKTYGKAMAEHGLPGYGIIPFSYCTEDYIDDWYHYCTFYAVAAERTK